MIIHHLRDFDEVDEVSEEGNDFTLKFTREVFNVSGISIQFDTGVCQNKTDWFHPTMNIPQQPTQTQLRN